MSGSDAVNARVESIVEQLGEENVRRQACKPGVNPDDGKIGIGRIRVCIKDADSDPKLSDFKDKESFMKHLRDTAKRIQKEQKESSEPSKKPREDQVRVDDKVLEFMQKMQESNQAFMLKLTEQMTKRTTNKSGKHSDRYCCRVTPCL